MIYELRTDRVHAGRMADLLARFRDHTCALFEKHGIRNVGYWLNTIGGRSDEMTYVLAYDNTDARQTAWANFLADPDWRKVWDESEAAGPIVDHLVNRIMTPTDFSPLR